MFLPKNQKEVLEKFFYPLAFAFLTFVVAVVCTEMDRNGDMISTLWKVLSIVALGISIGFGIEFLEIQDAKKRNLARIAGLAFIAFQILVSWFMVDVRKFSSLYVNLFLLSHLFVALSFWFNQKNRHLPTQERNQKFWNQNWRLFIGFQSSVLVNAVLFMGLALALLSLKFLFGFEPSERTYLYLFYALATMGGTFYLGAFWLSDYKDDTESKILTTLVRYIFPFLQILYFFILYVYLIKIISMWSLPRGYVGWLVSGLSVLSCLSHLIIKPVQERFSQNVVMQTVWRSSFMLMIPLLGLMLISLYRRITEYGLTEKRFVLLVLTFWMVYIAFTHLKPQKAKLQSIPLSLFLVALVTTTGPLNSYTISHWSQSRRLMSILTELKGEFKNNELVFAGPVANPDQVRLVRTMKSMCDNYGVTDLYKTLGSQDIPVILPSEESYCYYQNGTNDSSRKPFGKLLASTHFEVLTNDNLFSYSYSGEGHVAGSSEKSFSFSTSQVRSGAWGEAFGFEIGAFDMNEYMANEQGSQQLRFQKTGREEITWRPEKGSLKLIDLKPIFEKLAQKDKTYIFNDHPEDQNLELENEFSKVKIRFTTISFRQNSDVYRIQNVNFVAITPSLKR